MRALARLGSSWPWPDAGNCDCAFYLADGSPDPDQCNCASLIYCDGSSFSGYRPEPWPVEAPGRPPSPNNVSHLSFRGLRNLDAALDHLVGMGLDKASEVVVTGGSAGGLSTFLHSDRIAKRAPFAKVRALPIVGYFLNHEEMGHGDPNYRTTMDYVRRMQNITDGALSAECLLTYPSEKWRCIMSPYMQRFVHTPFFMLNSKFDYWQLGCILDVGCLCTRNTSQSSNQCAPGPSTCWSNPLPHNTSLSLLAPAAPPIVGENCNASQRDAILSYGDAFLSALAPVLHEPQNGAFITSCICHACDWAQLSLGGSALGHFSDWYHGRTSGAGAIAVDTRGPNGDGDLERGTKEPGWANCSDGYYPPAS